MPYWGERRISLVQVLFYMSAYMNFVQFHYCFTPLSAIHYNNTIQNCSILTTLMNLYVYKCVTEL